LSAQWASLLIRDADDDSYRDGHAWVAAQKEIKALEEDNRALSKRVAELEVRLKQEHRLKFKAKRKRPDPDRNDNADKRPAKRGAPEGHPPWQRSVPDHVDRSVEVPAPATCPHCDHKQLTPASNKHTQLQEDIVLQPRTVVTEYVHHMAYCPKCRREVFQTADEELRNCSIGPVTKAVAVYLRHEAKLSYRDIQKVFSGLFGMPFVPASAMAFSHGAAQQGDGLYEDLRNKIRASHIAHADETHWRIDGQGAFLWYGGNEQVAFFHADSSRSSDVAISIFGESFQGNLVTDSYATYNAVTPKKRQVCLA